MIARKLNLKQGPAVIDLNFGGDKATGNMSMSGQDRPVSVDLGGPLFPMPLGRNRLSPACRWRKAIALLSGTRRPKTESENRTVKGRGR